MEMAGISGHLVGDRELRNERATNERVAERGNVMRPMKEKTTKVEM